MSITIQCQCSRVISVSEELAGQPTRCPSCGRRHLIPQVRRVQVEARKADLSGRHCRDCHTELVKGAEFCHSCGLPHSTPKSVVEQVPVHTTAQVHSNATAPQPVMMAAPIPQMAHPFAAGCCGTRQVQGPFAAAMKIEKPVSGLSKVAMSCAYIAILLGIFTALAAVPMVGHLRHKVALDPAQAASLMTLVKGMGALIAMFSLVGLVTGFLGMFHFGRRRCGAVLGMVLCFFVGASAVHNIHRLDVRYQNQGGPADVRMEDGDCHRGCCPFECDRERSRQETAPQQQQQQAAPQQDTSDF